MNVSYNSYLQLDSLLQLQHSLSKPEEHDEHLFITIHQVYELWFKQILHEGDALVAHLSNNQIPSAIHTIKRVRSVLKTLVSQVDILETMTPLSFASFRDRLQQSSGFQSRQFREVELLFGGRLSSSTSHLNENDQKRLHARAQKTSIFAGFVTMLQASGYPITDDTIQQAQHSTEPNADLHPVLISIYKDAPTLGGVAEELIDIDEGLQEWRYRHVKMVERTIGTKQGTGGSDGASYLRNTLFKPCFADLWEIRIHF